MRNKQAFQKAQEKLDNNDQVKTIHYLKMLNLKDVHAQTYLWLDVNCFFNHDEVFEHFERTKNGTGKDAALKLVSQLGQEFWVGQDYDPNMYVMNSNYSSYVKIDNEILQDIIDKYKQYK